VTTWAIVVAAGSGDRYGGPKQYERLGDRRVLDWSLGAARAACDGVVVVVHPDRAGDDEGADAVVAGGATRSDSVRAGLAAVPDDADVVLVHDAARPRVPAAVWRRVIEGVRAGADAVVPAVPVIDTLRELGGGTVDRSRFVAVQTPQGFAAAALRSAHAGGGDATDDAALVEAAGGMVLVVDGDPAAAKITAPHDLRALEAFL
jgi:2-C-methyl-D-erythritol 4-phosphate cytidylyltransferase